ncbi:hypothetical protein [Streptomyces sp. NPDC086519]
MRVTFCAGFGIVWSKCPVCRPRCVAITAAEDACALVPVRDGDGAFVPG